MKKIELHIALLTFVILSFLLSGCYTQLAVIDDEPEEVVEQQPTIIVIGPPPPEPCVDCWGPEPIPGPPIDHPRPPVVTNPPVVTQPAPPQHRESGEVRGPFNPQDDHRQINPEPVRPPREQSIPAPQNTQGPSNTRPDNTTHGRR